MQPAIFQINTLLVDQPTTGAGTLVPATIGSAGVGNLPFSYNLPIGKKVYFEVEGIFSLGATGGFRFLVDNAGTETIYSVKIAVEENTTPATFRTNLLAQAAFANASAVAANYSLSIKGAITNNTPGGLLSIQFAQNAADVLPITLRAGMTFKLWIE